MEYVQGLYGLGGVKGTDIERKVAGLQSRPFHVARTRVRREKQKLRGAFLSQKSRPRLGRELLLMTGAPRQPEIRRGSTCDLPAVVSLLESAGLPTADLANGEPPQLWNI
jgi:hypothetical protein